MSSEDFSDAWPWSELVSLEEALRCPICGEFLLATRTLVGCGHSCAFEAFEAERETDPDASDHGTETCAREFRTNAREVCCTCLGRHFRYQLENGGRTNCAICREACDPSDGRNNKPLDEVVNQWSLARTKLLDVVKREATGRGSTVPTPSEDQAVRGARRREDGRNETDGDPVPRSHPTSRNDASTTAERPTDRTLGRHGNEAEVLVLEDEEAMDRTARTEEPVPDGMSRCPICGILVLEGLVSSHVDTCLTKAESRLPRRLAARAEKTSRLRSREGEPDSIEAPRKVPKLNLHMLKEKELKRHLQRYGLSLHGSRKELEARYKEFELRMNAYLSQGSKRTYESVSAEVDRLEKDRRRAIAREAFHASVASLERDREGVAFEQHVAEIRRRKRGILERDRPPRERSGSKAHAEGAEDARSVASRDARGDDLCQG